MASIAQPVKNDAAPDARTLAAGNMMFLPQFKGAAITVDSTAETRCPVCNMKFFAGRLAPGSQIEIRCRKCKSFTRLKVV